MRIHHISLDLTAGDLTSMVQEFAPDAKFRITTITPEGIRGQVKLLIWSIDFVARPNHGQHDTVSVEITASKLVPIPNSIVQRQLKEAMRDAPPGIDVIQQALKVHVPSILEPFGVELRIRELRCLEGFLHLSLEDIALPAFTRLMSGVSRSPEKS